MRSIANIISVVVLLMMIWSVIQSPGDRQKILSSKMPRVLLATILVNMSWFLMAQLVDVSTIVISGVGQLTQSFMDKASFSTVTAQQLVQATPSEIRINDKGCLAVERNASSRDMESILNSRNHLL